MRIRVVLALLLGLLAIRGAAAADDRDSIRKSVLESFGRAWNRTQLPRLVMKKFAKPIDTTLDMQHALGAAFTGEVSSESLSSVQKEAQQLIGALSTAPDDIPNAELVRRLEVLREFRGFLKESRGELVAFENSLRKNEWLITVDAIRAKTTMPPLAWLRWQVLPEVSRITSELTTATNSAITRYERHLGQNPEETPTQRDELDYINLRQIYEGIRAEVETLIYLRGDGTVQERQDRIALLEGRYLGVQQELERVQEQRKFIEGQISKLPKENRALLTAATEQLVKAHRAEQSLKSLQRAISFKGAAIAGKDLPFRFVPPEPAPVVTVPDTLVPATNETPTGNRLPGLIPLSELGPRLFSPEQREQMKEMNRLEEERFKLIRGKVAEYRKRRAEELARAEVLATEYMKEFDASIQKRLADAAAEGEKTLDQLLEQMKSAEGELQAKSAEFRARSEEWLAERRAAFKEFVQKNKTLLDETVGASAKKASGNEDLVRALVTGIQILGAIYGEGATGTPAATPQGSPDTTPQTTPQTTPPAAPAAEPSAVDPSTAPIPAPKSQRPPPKRPKIPAPKGPPEENGEGVCIETSKDGRCLQWGRALPLVKKDGVVTSESFARNQLRTPQGTGTPTGSPPTLEVITDSQAGKLGWSSNPK